jgi:hypothetical protein
LTRLQAIVAKGLAATADAWSPLRIAYGWVHQTAQILENEAQAPATEVRGCLDTLFAEMRRDQASVGPLAPAVAHFLKVSASYGPGLFHCYEVDGLPRTNNDQEQYFGSARYHERRASGRIHASAATVVRGAVRVVAAVTSRLHLFGERHLRHPDLERWRQLRHSLELRHEARRQQGRFRRDPDRYLANLETDWLTSGLPS